MGKIDIHPSIRVYQPEGAVSLCPLPWIEKLCVPRLLELLDNDSELQYMFSDAFSFSASEFTALEWSLKKEIPTKFDGSDCTFSLTADVTDKVVILDVDGVTPLTKFGGGYSKNKKLSNYGKLFQKYKEDILAKLKSYPLSYWEFESFSETKFSPTSTDVFKLSVSIKIKSSDDLLFQPLPLSSSSTTTGVTEEVQITLMHDDFIYAIGGSILKLLSRGLTNYIESDVRPKRCPSCLPNSICPLSDSTCQRSHFNKKVLEVTSKTFKQFVIVELEKDRFVDLDAYVVLKLIEDLCFYNNHTMAGIKMSNKESILRATKALDLGGMILDYRNTKSHGHRATISWVYTICKDSMIMLALLKPSHQVTTEYKSLCSIEKLIRENGGKTSFVLPSVIFQSEEMKFTICKRVMDIFIDFVDSFAKLDRRESDAAIQKLIVAKNSNVHKDSAKAIKDMRNCLEHSTTMPFDIVQRFYEVIYYCFQQFAKTDYSACVGEIHVSLEKLLKLFDSTHTLKVVLPIVPTLTDSKATEVSRSGTHGLDWGCKYGKVSPTMALTPWKLPSQLIGRDTEKVTLKHYLAGSDSTSLVYITGEQGIGKTALGACISDDPTLTGACQRWVKVYTVEDFEEALTQWARDLGIDSTSTSDVTETIKAIDEKLKTTIGGKYLFIDYILDYSFSIYQEDPSSIDTSCDDGSSLITSSTSSGSTSISSVTDDVDGNALRDLILLALRLLDPSVIICIMATTKIVNHLEETLKTSGRVYKTLVLNPLTRDQSLELFDAQLTGIYRDTDATYGGINDGGNPAKENRIFDWHAIQYCESRKIVISFIDTFLSGFPFLIAGVADALRAALKKASRYTPLGPDNVQQITQEMSSWFISSGSSSLSPYRRGIAYPASCLLESLYASDLVNSNSIDLVLLISLMPSSGIPMTVVGSFITKESKLAVLQDSFICQETIENLRQHEVINEASIGGKISLTFKNPALAAGLLRVAGNNVKWKSRLKDVAVSLISAFTIALRYSYSSLRETIYPTLEEDITFFAYNLYGQGLFTSIDDDYEKRKNTDLYKLLKLLSRQILLTRTAAACEAWASVMVKRMRYKLRGSKYTASPAHLNIYDIAAECGATAVIARDLDQLLLQYKDSTEYQVAAFNIVLHSIGEQISTITSERLVLVSTAESYFQSMVTAGLKPNEITFNSLITACANVKEAKWSVKAEEYFQSMVTAGLKPDEITFSSLITACQWFPEISRSTSKATKYLDQLFEAGCVPNSYTLLACMSCCVNRREQVSRDDAIRLIMKCVNHDDFCLRSSDVSFLQNGPAFRKLFHGDQEMVDLLSSKVRVSDDGRGRGRGRGRGMGGRGRGMVGDGGRERGRGMGDRGRGRGMGGDDGSGRERGMGGRGRGMGGDDGSGRGMGERGRGRGMEGDDGSGRGRGW